MKNLKQYISGKAEAIKESLLLSKDFLKAYGFVFLPSVTLILGGLVVFVRPDLWVPVMATFFVALGGTLGCVTWKLILLRERAQEIMEKFDGKILIHGGVRLQDEQGIDPNDDPNSQILH